MAGPAEVVGPAWRDKPDAEGWWMRRREGGATTWHLLRAGDAPLPFFKLPSAPGDRWFGPLRMPEDSK
jgi:hypothetical protein